MTTQSEYAFEAGLIEQLEKEKRVEKGSKSIEKIASRTNSS